MRPDLLYIIYTSAWKYFPVSLTIHVAWCRSRIEEVHSLHLNSSAPHRYNLIHSNRALTVFQGTVLLSNEMYECGYCILFLPAVFTFLEPSSHHSPRDTKCGTCYLEQCSGWFSLNHWSVLALSFRKWGYLYQAGQLRRNQSGQKPWLLSDKRPSFLMDTKHLWGCWGPPGWFPLSPVT